MQWDSNSRLVPWLTAPLAFVTVLVTLSLLDANQRQTLLVVTCCMLGVVPVVLFQAYRNDIRKRDLTELLHREGEERHRLLLQLSPFPILLCQKGRILEANPAWDHLINAINPDVYTGHRLREFLDLATAATVEERLLESENHSTETTIPDAAILPFDGTLVNVEISVIPATHRTRSALQLVIRSINEQRRASAAIQQAQRDSNAVADLKSTFLANISHEIRTPLNAITGMSGLLLDTPLDTRQHSFLTSIRHSSEHLLSMFNDLLDLAKCEAGQLTLEPAPFDLERSLGELLELLYPQARLKGIDISLIYGPNVPRRVIADAGRIRQVAIHLVQNAIRFTERGRILVAVQEERRTEDATLIRISVSDTGAGIHDDQLKHLFTPFAPSRGGMGVGLSLSQRLIELMNGAIGVTSKTGLGSTFHFQLPLALDQGETPEPRPALAPPAADDEVFRGRRILLVDDNAVNQKLGAALFEKFGARVDVAANGREAVEMSAQLPYDAIFMDCQMPEMDGYEATSQIRRRENGTRHTPIVAMTAHAFRADQEKCASAGMDDYLPKPVNLDDIRNLLIALSAHEPQCPDPTRSAKLDAC